MIESVFLTVHPRRSCTRDLSRIAGSNDSHNLLNRSSTFQKHLYESLILPPPRRGRTQPPDLFTPRFCSVLCKRGDSNRNVESKQGRKWKGLACQRTQMSFGSRQLHNVHVCLTALCKYTYVQYEPQVFSCTHTVYTGSPQLSPLCVLMSQCKHMRTHTHMCTSTNTLPGINTVHLFDLIHTFIATNVNKMRLATELM